MVVMVMPDDVKYYSEYQILSGAGKITETDLEIQMRCRFPQIYILYFKLYFDTFPKYLSNLNTKQLKLTVHRDHSSPCLPRHPCQYLEPFHNLILFLSLMSGVWFGKSKITNVGFRSQDHWVDQEQCYKKC